jgi:hypothetical protein
MGGNGIRGNLFSGGNYFSVGGNMPADPVVIDTDRYMAEQTRLMDRQIFIEQVLDALDVVRKKVEKFDFTPMSSFEIRVDLDDIKATLSHVVDKDPTDI